MPKILHIITGLGRHGAELQLSNLVGIGSEEFCSAIFSIRSPGEAAESFAKSGVAVFSGFASKPASLQWIGELGRVTRSWRPDVISGWLYHGNLAAAMASGLGHRVPVIWNVRHSIHDLRLEKFSTRNIIRLGAWASGSASRIIYNSEVAARQHEAIGYQARGRVVLPNGFDVNRFRTNVEARATFRRSLGVGADEILLGVVGRAHPMKNHLAWVDAFSLLRERGLPVRGVIVGQGVDDERGTLARAVLEKGLGGWMSLVPATSALELVYPGFDLLVSPSRYGEGFPNVVGEAMACGVPAAVTDVGDSGAVVGDAGFLLSGHDSEALADGVVRAIQGGRGTLRSVGEKARMRVIERFSMDTVAKRYYSVFKEVLDDPIQ